MKQSISPKTFLTTNNIKNDWLESKKFQDADYEACNIFFCPFGLSEAEMPVLQYLFLAGQVWKNMLDSLVFGW